MSSMKCIKWCQCLPDPYLPSFPSFNLFSFLLVWVVFWHYSKTHSAHISLSHNRHKNINDMTKKVIKNPQYSHAHMALIHSNTAANPLPYPPLLWPWLSGAILAHNSGTEILYTRNLKIQIHHHHLQYSSAGFQTAWEHMPFFVIRPSYKIFKQKWSSMSGKLRQIW